MGQEEVMEILKNSKSPLSRTEIAKLLKIEPPEKVSDILTKLIKHREVRFIELDRRLALKFYHCKRKLKLYFL